MLSRLWLLALVSSVVTRAFAYISLNESQVKSKTANHHWLILYTATDDLVNQWQSLSDNYSDWQSYGVYFAQVDCNKEACEDVKKSQIRLYSEGALVQTVDPGKTSTWQPVLEQHILSSAIARSVPITNMDMLTRIKQSGSPWFIKYYAPWCGHCKNLAPVWENLAMDHAASNINLGEVNCETNRDLCSAENVAGLPTIYFYNHGFRFTFTGQRDLDSFKAYLQKMTGPAFQTTDHAALPSILKEPVSLVYVHAAKQKNMDDLERVAKGVMDRLPVYTTSDPKMDKALKGTGKLPRLVMIKHDGAVQLVNDGATSTWLSWVQSHQYPLVTRIASNNANEILKGKRMVALLLQSSDQLSNAFEDVSSQWEQQEHDTHVTFAQLNAQTWSAFAKRVYSVETSDLPAIVIVDPIRKLYFKTDLHGDVFSITQSEALFAALEHPEQLQGQTTDVPRSMSLVQKALVFMGDHGLKLSIGLIILAAIVFVLSNSRDPLPTAMPIDPRADDDDHEKKE
ncbi:hypothetical protein BC940DRAFT_287630 [Gongronella butleri]|nr:hypothetical protein BC940DRAFT_287630 [Gongronella butleri]